MAEPAPPVLRVDGLGKKFARDLRHVRRYGVADILGEFRLRRADPDVTLRDGEFWALRDAAFDVAPGEALGVIGHNGAGKSTLLRLLTGVIRPDEGSVEIAGTTTALLELNAPFNAVLSGRENIVTAASIHGVDLASIDELVDAVADFSELGALVEAPLWTYSTGMQMRLGYAIAAQLRPDLLVVDEVIAVGDIAFQRKCVSHIRRHLARGGSLVLVSHDLWMIQALCERCLVLSGGEVVEDTHPNQAISAYMRELRRGALFVRAPEPGVEPADDASSDRLVAVEDVACSGSAGDAPTTRAPFEIQFRLRSTDETRRVTWYVDVLAPNHQACVARFQPSDGDDGTATVGDDACTVAFSVDELPLFPGTFHLVVHVIDPVTGEEVGSSLDPVTFEVVGRDTRLHTLAQLSNVMFAVDGAFSVPRATVTEERPR